MDIIFVFYFFLHILSLFSQGLEWISMCILDIHGFYTYNSVILNQVQDLMEN